MLLFLLRIKIKYLIVIISIVGFIEKNYEYISILILNQMMDGWVYVKCYLGCQRSYAYHGGIT